MKCSYCDKEFDGKKGWARVTKMVETPLNRKVEGVTQDFCSPECMANGAKKLFTFNKG